METKQIYEALKQNYAVAIDDKKDLLIKATDSLCRKVGVNPIVDNKPNFQYAKMISQHKAVLLDFAVMANIEEEPTTEKTE